MARGNVDAEQMRGNTGDATKALFETGFAVPSGSSANYADGETPSGSINSSNVTFTVAHTPSPAGSLLLFVNGVLQLAGTDYTLVTATITMTSAPDTNAWMRASYRY